MFDIDEYEPRVRTLASGEFEYLLVGPDNSIQPIPPYPAEEWIYE